MDRYRDQAVYFIKGAREALVRMEDAVSSSVITDMIQVLAHFEVDPASSTHESILPSPEILEFLYLIDLRAIDFAQEHASTSISDLSGHLIEDRDLVERAKRFPNCPVTDEQAKSFLQFVVDVTGNSIWCTVSSALGTNDRNATVLSFRASVHQGESSRTRKCH